MDDSRGDSGRSERPPQSPPQPPPLANRYWNIQDILAEAELITCEFPSIDALDIGYLDPENEHQHLPAGSSISLPFWLVSILSHRLPHDFAYSLPPIYNPTRNSALLADPRAFNLSLYPHYYTLSILLYQLPVAPTAANSDDSAQYQQLLLRHMTQVMDERYKEIVTKSASCSRGGRGRLAGMGSDLLRSGGECGFLSSPGVEAAAKLSVWERDVFGWNALALRKFEWWKGQVGPMRVTDRSGGMGMGLVERKRVYGGGGESGSNRDRNKRGRG